MIDYTSADHGLRIERVRIPTQGLPRWQKYAKQLRRPRFIILEDIAVRLPGGLVVRLPRGFESDGGSVPVIALTFLIPFGLFASVDLMLALWVVAFCAVLLNPIGLLLVVFLIHDFAVRYRALLLTDGSLIPVGTVWEANRLIININQALNHMPFLGWFAFAGATLGAWLPWRNHRKNDGTPINSIDVYQEAEQVIQSTHG